MSIIKLTILNRSLFLLNSGGLLFFHQAPQVEKESGAEGEEEIGDSQEPLRIIPYIYQLSISYGLKKTKNLCTISFLLPRSW